MWDLRIHQLWYPLEVSGKQSLQIPEGKCTHNFQSWCHVYNSLWPKETHRTQILEAEHSSDIILSIISPIGLHMRRFIVSHPNLALNRLLWTCFSYVIICPNQPHSSLPFSFSSILEGKQNPLLLPCSYLILLHGILLSISIYIYYTSCYHGNQPHSKILDTRFLIFNR